MIINHNLTAMNTARQYNIISSNRVKSTEKLSSGYKINRAADDAAGLSISEKMRWQIRGLNKAVTNIQDGVSLVQVTDGALSEADNILQRMRELSVQAANDTNTDQDRQALQAEIDQNIKELNRIAETTTFNGIHTLRADDQYAVDPDIATITTPTAIGKGIYRMDKDDISLSQETFEALRELRKFMFEHVYKNPVAKSEEVKAKAMIKQLFFYYMEHIELLPQKYFRMLENGEKKERVVSDYIAGMTDQYAITKFSEYFLPQAWQVDGY